MLAKYSEESVQEPFVCVFFSESVARGPGEALFLTRRAMATCCFEEGRALRYAPDKLHAAKSQMEEDLPLSDWDGERILLTIFRARDLLKNREPIHTDLEQASAAILWRTRY